MDEILTCNYKISTRNHFSQSQMKYRLVNIKYRRVTISANHINEILARDHKISMWTYFSQSQMKYRRVCIKYRCVTISANHINEILTRDYSNQSHGRNIDYKIQRVTISANRINEILTRNYKIATRTIPTNHMRSRSSHAYSDHNRVLLVTWRFRIAGFRRSKTLPYSNFPSFIWPVVNITMNDVVIQRVKSIIYTAVTIAGSHNGLRNQLWRHHQTQQVTPGHPVESRRATLFKGRTSDRASRPFH